MVAKTFKLQKRKLRAAFPAERDSSVICRTELQAGVIQGHDVPIMKKKISWGDFLKLTAKTLHAVAHYCFVDKALISV